MFVDETGKSSKPRLIFFFRHTIYDARVREGQPLKASERVFFVEIDEQGRAQLAGYAPYLDYRAPTESAMEKVERIKRELNWAGQDMERRAINAADNLVMPHFYDKQDERNRYVDKVKAAVEDRLMREILHQRTQEQRFREQAPEGERKTRLRTRRKPPGLPSNCRIGWKTALRNWRTSESSSTSRRS